MKKIKILFGVIIVVSFILVTLSLQAVSKKEQYSIRINLAGKQRMLTQKMVKEVLLILAEIDTAKNRENLRQTVDLFRKTLDGLRDGDSSLRLDPVETEHIKTQINAVRSLFKEIEFIFDRIITGEKPTRDALLELAEKNIFLLKNMNIVVEMFEEEARSALEGTVAFLGIEINLSGKQRMLSQKMAKEVLFIYFEINSRHNKKLLHTTYTLFDKTLKGLKYGDGDLGLPGTTDKNIAQQIDAINKTWSELKPIIERSSDIMLSKIPKEDIMKLAELNILLLEQMDKAVMMYENLAR